MKKLLIILLLLITSYSYGQAVLSGSKGWNGAYNLRADQFFTRCVTAGVTLTTAQKQWYNDSIFVPLSDSGLIGATRAGDSIQALWCYATFPNGSASVCVLNLLSDSNTCLAVNSPTFTDSGVVGNGTSSYLNTNFNPVWDSSIFKSSSAGLIVYYKRFAGVNMFDAGHFSGTNGTVFGSGDLVIYTRIVSSDNFSIASSRKLGTFGLFRTTGTNVYYLYQTTINNTTLSMTTLTNLNIYIFAINVDDVASNNSNAVIPFFAITSGLSIDKSRALSNILNNSLKGRGYNVY